MIGGVRPAASCAVQSVGHGVTVLAFPLSGPLDAVSVGYAFTVLLEWVAWSTPLLESSLPFRVCCAAASEAGLCFSVVLYVVLAVPVSVCTFLTWEVYRSVGS